MKAYAGFSTTKSVISNLIRWFRSFANKKRTWATHCFPIVKLGESFFTIDAEAQCVNLNHFTHLNNKKYKVKIMEYEVTEKEYEETLSYFLDKVVGREYGFLQLGGDAIVSFLQRFGIKIKNLIRLSWVCSEVLFVFMVKTINKDFHKDLCKTLASFYKDSVAPDEILQAMEDNGCRTIAEKEIGDNELHWFHII